MGLKLLVFPSILVLSLVLAIWVIQPRVMTIMEQRAVEQVKREALAKVESVETNIRVVTEALATRKESEQFVYRYYPEKSDQERAVDMLNFLAQQSGVVITSFAVTQEPERKKSVAQPQAEEGAIFDPTQKGEVQAIVPSTYEVNVRVVGPYVGLRNFFERMYRTDRLHSLENFGVNEIQRTSQDEEGAFPPEFLEGFMNIEFPFVPQKRAGNVLIHPLFQSGTLDFGSVNRLVDFVNSPVSDLTLPPKGRMDPFQSLP